LAQIKFTPTFFHLAIYLSIYLSIYHKPQNKIYGLTEHN